MARIPTNRKRKYNPVCTCGHTEANHQDKLCRVSVVDRKTVGPMPKRVPCPCKGFAR